MNPARLYPLLRRLPRPLIFSRPGPPLPRLLPDPLSGIDARSRYQGHGVFQDLGILGVLGKQDHVAIQVLHQVVVKAISLQELEGIVPRADRLELDAVEVFVVLVLAGMERSPLCNYHINSR